MKLREGKVAIDIGSCNRDDLTELSVSRAKKWRGCQKAHDYKYVDNIIPKKKVRPLTLGSLVHSCLESRAQGDNWVQVIRDFKKGEWANLFEEERAELGDIPNDAFRIMRGYHYYYSETDKNLEVIAAEVPFRIRLKRTKIVLTGIIDLIVRDTRDGSIWGFEHKTAKQSIPTEEFRMTDIQTTVYMYAMGLLAPKLGFDPSHIKGMMLDYLKTKPPTMPEILKNGTVSKRKITCDYYTFLKCIEENGQDPAEYEEVLEYMKTNVFYRRVPITKSQHLVDETLSEMITVGKQIRSLSGKKVTRNLSWTCDRPKCEYRDLCIADLQGLDTSMMIKLSFERRGGGEDGEESEPELE